MPTTSSVQSDRDFVFIERVFTAPRELVIRAWTEPEQLLRWFAPPGCSIRYELLDLRAGGSFHSCVLTPDGHECWCKGKYREVVFPERLVFKMAVADAQGNLKSPTEMGMHPDWPRETVCTVTFADEADNTRLTLHQTVNTELAKQTGAYPSWLLMLDRLAETLG